MAMTMRRTRHKLEPQCVHKESFNGQGKQKQLRRDTTDKQAHGTHESSVVVLVSVHMLQVCGHIKHVVVFVALLSYH